MKTIWQLTYETIPGNGEQTKKYKSFDEAKKDIRKIISNIYIFPYTESILKGGDHIAYRTAMADFLDNYVSRNDFFHQSDIFPSCEPDDYKYEKKLTIKNEINDDIDDYDWYDDEEPDDCNDFNIYIDKDSISVSFDHNKPPFETNMVTMDNEKEEYFFDFFIDGDYDNQDKYTEVQIKLIPLPYWGTSAYPFMILHELEKSQTPLDQQQIIEYIESSHNTTIERKAIGRNISLLKNLGYDIRHGAKGYYISKNKFSLTQEDLQTIVGCINKNEALPYERKCELIDKLFKL